MNAAKRALLDRLQEMVERARNVSFVVPDDTGFFSIEDDLIAQVRRVIEDALELMRDVSLLYEEESHDEPNLDAEADEDHFLEIIGAAISSELAAQEVASIAFAARSQLVESYDALRGALDNGYIWVVASHADTGLRRVGRGLISLDGAIREYEGLEPTDRFWSDIRDSLEIRSLYGQFRRAIMRLGEPEDLDQLEQWLRRASNRIAILRHRKIYPFLRVYDRIPIRRLQKRITAWLSMEAGSAAEEAEPTAGESSDGNPSQREIEGRRLWSDLTSFAELLAMVNHREDLREFDRKTVQRLHSVLYHDAPEGQDLATAHLQDLQELLGRDDDLDAVLLDPAKHNLTDLRAPLEGLLDQLNRPYEPFDTNYPSAPLAE